MDSILTSIKKMLGMEKDYTHFDADIIMHINTVLGTLTQIGVGPSEGFFIEDETAIWDDFLEDVTKYQAVKTYVFLKVKLLFDPPTSSAVMQAYTESAKEFEWRLNWTAECAESTES